ncbi:MAG: hypothetical protein IT391_06125 [Nitrospira sp.]|nr:hypothetical protein [Nitrospira sp.]
MSHPFTGQSSLTGFAFLLSDLLWLNEVNRRDPYHLYVPPSANSGYSFGAVQWDIPNHAPLSGARKADEIIRDILLHAQNASGQLYFTQSEVDQIVDTSSRTGLAYLKGNTTALNAYIGRINDALDSTYGRAVIDADHGATINSYVAWINDTIALIIDPADQAIFSGANKDLAKLFIGDFRNQFGTTANNQLRSYLQGQAVVGITKQGALGIDDLLNFYFRTPHAALLPHDPIRRFGHIVETVGYAPADAQEAKGVLQAYTSFVVPHRSQIQTANAAALNVFMNLVVDPARGVAIGVYASSHTIGGEVLVGQDNLGRGDILEGTANGDLLFGEKGADVLRGLEGADVLYGGEGIDTLSGGAGEDWLYGDDGDDTLDGGTENDVMEGGEGRDTLVGGAGIDLLRGGTENDTLIGGTGDDLLEGGGGFDTYIYNLGDGADTIIDSDGKGQVNFKGQVLKVGLHRANDPSNVYRSADGTITLTKTGNDLVITGSGPLTIKNFDFTNGMLGITLKEAPVTATVTPST